MKLLGPRTATGRGATYPIPIGTRNLFGLPGDPLNGFPLKTESIIRTGLVVPMVEEISHRSYTGSSVFLGRESFNHPNGELLSFIGISIHCGSCVFYSQNLCNLSRRDRLIYERRGRE